MASQGRRLDRYLKAKAIPPYPHPTPTSTPTTLPLECERRLYFANVLVYLLKLSDSELDRFRDMNVEEAWAKIGGYQRMNGARGINYFVAPEQSFRTGRWPSGRKEKTLVHWIGASKHHTQP